LWRQRFAFFVVIEASLFVPFESALAIAGDALGIAWAGGIVEQLGERLADCYC
jgi:hypothetical protein